MFPTPHEEFVLAITEFEGGFSSHPKDLGNYINGRLVGTMRGVTGRVWAAYRGIPPHLLTMDDVRAITLDDAASVYHKLYYVGSGLAKVVWCAPTVIACEVAWGSGQVVAVKALQQLCGTQRDGSIGPATFDAYTRWIKRLGHANATQAFKLWRDGFYRLCVERRPANSVFLNGWLRRSNFHSIQNPRWWPLWKEWELAHEGNAIAPASNILPEGFFEQESIDTINTPSSWLEETIGEIGEDGLDMIINDAFEITVAELPILGETSAIV